MKASYYDSVNDEVVEVKGCSASDIRDLLYSVVALERGQRHPTLEFKHDNGSSLSLSTDGERAFLVWVDSLEEPFHSVGGTGGEDELFVFDYFGSWSEVPREFLVPLEDGIECAMKFFVTGTADTDRVLFEPG